MFLTIKTLSMTLYTSVSTKILVY